MATLWAWAVPTPFEDSPVDHTWVTDYDNRVNAYPNVAAVIAAQANYWFCWGDFHPDGSGAHQPKGYLGSAAGDLAWANCLCTSNASSASNLPTCGTIYHYGVDGVCHQLANQVLWSTSAIPGGPLTVAKARGYGLSTFFYGSYGLQHDAWSDRKTQCVPAGGQHAARGGTMKTAQPEDDEFVAKARAVLHGKDAEPKLAALLAIRAQAHTTLAAHKAKILLGAGSPSADELNAAHQARLHQASRLLSADEFSALFGIAPGEIDKVQLVVPQMHSRSEK
jgi:hypothetical protein